MLHIALVLFMAFKNHEHITVVPSLDIKLPFKKKGAPYQSNFDVMVKESTEEPSSTRAMVVYQRKIPAITTEVKLSFILVLFERVNHYECIEMLICCLYISSLIRLYN